VDRERPFAAVPNAKVIASATAKTTVVSASGMPSPSVRLSGDQGAGHADQHHTSQ